MLKPFQIIAEMIEQRNSCSDQEILEELMSLSVLPDETQISTDEDWQNVYLFLALAEQASLRRLTQAIPLLLGCASFGDPGETMRGLRHYLEAIVNPDWELLTEECMKAASYPQRGARLWAVHELGILRDERARPVLETALHDPESEIRNTAHRSLTMLDAAKRISEKVNHTAQ